MGTEKSGRRERERERERKRKGERERERESDEGGLVIERDAQSTGLRWQRGGQGIRFALASVVCRGAKTLEQPAALEQERKQKKQSRWWPSGHYSNASEQV